MANEEHLKILKSGVEKWNKWRDKNLDIIPDLKGADLHEARLHEANLSWSNLAEADFSWADLTGADLTGADLTAAGVEAAHLTGANLTKARLHEADLSWSNLAEANLVEAKLIHVELRVTDLTGADLTGADLTAAILSETNLRRANFTEVFLDATIFASCNLSEIKHLDKANHRGPSEVSVATLYLSGGNIPDSFLRGTGVPDNLVDLLPSLTGKAFDFYSSFISYSRQDSTFVDRLFADMRGNHIRCWLDREDLKIGDKIRSVIDRAIRTHDKLLLVLSEESIQSGWVEDEVETAFEKEQKRKKRGNEVPVLFPITIDDAIWNCEAAWAAKIRRTRHIGDFRKWKDHNEYQKSFQRLLRDLEGPKPDEE